MAKRKKIDTVEKTVDRGDKSIVYFSNGIGNLVMMLPAIHTLATVSKKPVDVVLDARWNDGRRGAIEKILSSASDVGRVINYPDDPIIVSDYDRWFLSPHNATSDAVRIFRDNMSYQPVPKPLWRESLMHEEDHYFEVLQRMGIRRVEPGAVFPFEMITLSFVKPRPMIVLCNGCFSADYWKKKRWPYFGQLADALRSYFGGTVVGIGNSGELDGCVLDVDFTGKLSITETAGVIYAADLVVSTDTGNMHIADNLGAKLIALFGSTLVSKNSPTRSSSHVIMSDVECSPCQETGRFYQCIDNRCMSSITVGDVMSVARRILR